MFKVCVVSMRREHQIERMLEGESGWIYLHRFEKKWGGRSYSWTS